MNIWVTIVSVLWLCYAILRSIRAWDRGNHKQAVALFIIGEAIYFAMYGLAHA